MKGRKQSCVVKMISLVAFLSMSSYTFSQITYTTLTNGTWNNITNVWSTDGVTACACAPGYTITNVNIVIDHAITLSTNLTLNAAAIVDVSASGSLNGVNRDVVINTGGFMEAYGPLNVRSVEIEIGGDGMYHNTVTCVDKFRVEGYAQIDTLVTVSDGDIEVKGTGVLDIFVSYIETDVPNGEFKVDGILNLHNTCLYVLNGNFRNKITGTITGSQYIEVLNGDIRDEGVWPVTVDWCASGEALTMPFPPDCSGCLLVLPIDLISFSAKSDQEKVHLNWMTGTGENGGTYFIERMQENTNWQTIGEVASHLHTSGNANYFFIDHSAPFDFLYYRLLYFDANNDTDFSETISINNKIQLPILSGYMDSTGRFYSDLNSAPIGVYIEMSNTGFKKIFYDGENND